MLNLPKRRLERYAKHQKYFLRDGSQVAGCSTIAKLGDSPEGIIWWAWDLGKKGKDYRKVRDSAADSGAIAHFMVDCHLTGHEPDLREFEKYEIDRAENSFIKFLDFWQREKLTVITIEKQMVSEKYRYGGTLDLLAWDENKKKVLLDWKSSRKLYQSHRWQLGGYEQLENENSEKPVDRRAIIRIGREPDDTFQAHWIQQEEIDKCMKIFQAQANLYNCIKDRP